MTDSQDVTRRDFIKGSVIAGTVLSGIGIPAVWGQESRRPLRVALIGCGGRGNHDLDNMVKAAALIQVPMDVHAVADVFEDRARQTAEKHGVPAERRFIGFGAYRQVLETDIDLVMLVTPPNFRPLHFEAAVAAGKHVFMEKPVAVDPPGARKIIAVGEAASKKNLAVLAGTQRRHSANYRSNQYAVEHGAIGPILGGAVMWCGDRLWFKERNPGESDAHYLVRNWVSFTEMSGDHIVEQHVHNLDVANWFIGRPPRWALGFGARVRRQTGNQNDFFSVDYDYGDGVHIHSMCRQISGCYTRVSEFFRGPNGSVWGGGKVESTKPVDIDIPEMPSESEDENVQEFVDLLRSLREDRPFNESRQVAEATLTAMMGRISAYTGQLVRWEDLTENADSPWYDLRLQPAADGFEAADVEAPPDNVAALPGTA